jgi:hypothetical protein
MRPVTGAVESLRCAGPAAAVVAEVERGWRASVNSPSVLPTGETDVEENPPAVLDPVIATTHVCPPS